MSKNSISKTIVALVVIAFVLFIDQWSKVWVKTHMALGDQFNVIGDWFRIYFVENNGMAFGIEAIGKLFLSIFRIVAVIFIAIFLTKLIRKNTYSHGFIACIALVLAGAFGNIIDSVFYGVIFDASYPGHVASFVPWGEGYASLLHGKVVDMLYFPLIEGRYPTWLPFVGGQEFLFFRFIFNAADSAISVGVVLLLLFYRKTLSLALATSEEKKEKSNPKL